MASGLPENVNPFCFINERDIMDGLLNGEIPLYFFLGRGKRKWTRWYKSKDLDNNFRPLPGAKPANKGWHQGEYTCAKVRLRCRELSQRDAEELVRRVLELSPTCAVAVQKKFAHIVPADLRGQIALAPNGRFRCRERELVKNCECFLKKGKTAK